MVGRGRYVRSRQDVSQSFVTEDTYDSMQVCLNGHMITDKYYDEAINRKGLCPTCGAETIYACPACGKEIKGHLKKRGVYFSSPKPNYCEECGEPFPWTKKALDAAKELLQETDLSQEDKDRANEDIEAIIQETPRMKAAIKRLKRYSLKAGDWVWGEIQSTLVECVSETAVKLLNG